MGSFPGASAAAPAKIPPRASRTRASSETPLARAAAASFASSCGSRRKVSVVGESSSAPPYRRSGYQFSRLNAPSSRTGMLRKAVEPFVEFLLPLIRAVRGSRLPICRVARHPGGRGGWHNRSPRRVLRASNSQVMCGHDRNRDALARAERRQQARCRTLIRSKVQAGTSDPSPCISRHAG